MRLLLKNKAVKSKTLIITFDDGPGSRLTPAILNLLAEHNAKATFFLLGRNIIGREALVRQIAAKGHEICSHGYEHLHYWRVSPIRSLIDIKKGWEAIDRALGQRQVVYPFRPPHGKLNLVSLLYLWYHKVPIYYWTLDTKDTQPVEKINNNLTDFSNKQTQGAVTLAHNFDRKNDNIDNMVLETLHSILSVARETGMRIRTMSEFMANTGEK